jgi:hypothetical protein
MPNTTNYSFEYESPSSLPGTTLTGGPGGTSPILAVQVDAALSAVEQTTENNAASIAANTASIAAGATAITNLQNWTRRGTALVNFTTQDSFTGPVSFGFTFPGVPTVVVNIDSGAGATGRWDARAITTSTTGFTLFVFSNASGSTNTWVDVPVSYIAHYD